MKPQKYSIIKTGFAMLALTAIVAALMTLAPKSTHAAVGIQGEKFQKIFYFYGPNGKGSASGLDAGNAKAISDTDLMSIPAGTVIENVYVIVDSAITGTTIMSIGDDDAAAGFVPASAITLGNAGIYGYSAKSKALGGATYLATSTAGTSANELYVVPNAKYYSAAGKEVKLETTTTNTAGQFRVVVEGYRLK